MVKGVKQVDLSWVDLLRKGMVFGLPNHYNGEFIEDLAYSNAKKEKKLLEKGIVSRFPTNLIKKYPRLKSSSSETSGVRIEFNTYANAMSISAQFPKTGRMDNMCRLGQCSMDVLVDGRAWLSYSASGLDADLYRHL